MSRSAPVPHRSLSWFILLAGSLAVSALTVAAEEPGGAAVPPNRLTSNRELEDRLTPLLQKHNVPGIVGGVIENGQLTAVASVGLRKAGSPEPITINDKLHLGSNTKAMTATLLARLVEEKRMTWESTIGDIFSDLKPAPHPDYRNVTVIQLLSHRAGLPANTAWWSLGKGSRVQQRQRLLETILVEPPLHPPDSKFLYSNVGYVIAGHMAEKVTGKSWEDLMVEYLFKPLKMPSAGFGIPGSIGKVDQPWGHQITDGKEKALQIDNAPALGPAGTVHCSLPDWSHFVGMHLEGARGTSQFLTPGSFQVLHTPVSGDEFACGWVVTDRKWANGTVLTHTGSNTIWFAMAWIAPELNAAFLAVVNHGDESGRSACDAAVVELIGYHKDQVNRRVPSADQ
ncbi:MULTISPECIES: serine hydrolase domain-containing protein [unclassified Schlesneria]|uniref:serine hydrolase domain-containing protein n=1 Tax=Schlesneria TaxID=656899 RepID=UPI002F215D31